MPLSKPSSKTLRTLTSLCLLLSLTACASTSPAPQEPVPCVHPVVDPSTKGGLYRALAAYYAALELCNSINGVSTPSKE